MFSHSWFWLPILQVIAKARVPIIKFVEKKSGVAFDIRFAYLSALLWFETFKVHSCIGYYYATWGFAFSICFSVIPLLVSYVLSLASQFWCAEWTSSCWVHKGLLHYLLYYYVKRKMCCNVLHQAGALLNLSSSF